MSRWRQNRWIAVYAILSLCGCTLVQAYGDQEPQASSTGGGEPSDDVASDPPPRRKGKKKKGKSKRVASDIPDPDAALLYKEPFDPKDEESGVRRINRLLRRFRSALGKKNFKVATKLLGRAERYSAKADTLTRSHPDFDDLTIRVRNSRARLDMAIEDDRIYRRNLAIGELIAQAGEAIDDGNNVYALLTTGEPDPDEFSRLKEILGRLADIEAEGRKYMDDPRYSNHVKERDLAVRTFIQLRLKVQWQLDAAKTISRPLDVAYEAAKAARDAKSFEEQVVGYRRSKAGFEACVARIDRLMDDTLYDPDALIPGRFGSITLVDTKRKCQEFSSKSDEKIELYRWRDGVDDVMKRVNETVAAARKIVSVKQAVAAHERALDALKTCSKKLPPMEKWSGYDASFRFESVFGPQNFQELKRSCAKEADRTAKAIPSLEWRGTLLGLQERLKKTKAAEESAKNAPNANAKAKTLKKAIGGLQECIERSQTAAKHPKADKSVLLETAYGRLNVELLERECTKRKKAANEALEEALAEQEKEEFLRSTRGDEQAVVRREGIPTKILKFPEGRVFIYERTNKRKKETKRYGFDKSGGRVDYWVQWRGKVITVVSELSRMLAPVRDAKSAGERLKAIEKSLPVIKGCRNVLRETSKHPGYDRDAVFSTPLGKHTIRKLADACDGERDRLVGQIPAQQWLSRLESLGSRYDEAMRKYEEASKMRSPKARVKALGTAIGGLQECVERAVSLGKAKAANGKAKVPTKDGSMSNWGLSKACADGKKKAEAALETALKDQELADFIRKTRGDEKEVARREGIPSLIEEYKTGRVFVYGSKRFAFDSSGKRMDERVLKSQSSGAPKKIKP